MTRPRAGTTRRRRAGLSWPLGLLLVLGGCSFERFPASAEQRAAALAMAVSPEDSDWPPRATDGLVALTLQVPRSQAGTGRPADAPAGSPDSERTTGRKLRIRLTPVATGLLQETVVVLDLPDGMQFTRSDHVSFHSWGPSTPIPLALRVGVRDGPPAVEAVEEALATATFQHRWTYVAQIFRQPRGLYVHLSSVTSSAAERRLMQEMLDRGWEILIAGALSSRDVADGVDSNPTPQQKDAYWLRRPAQLLADYAYSVEAALDWARRRHASVAGKPVVIGAFSFGATMAPTVVARLEDRIDAVLLVGGGANLFGIMAHSRAARFEFDAVRYLRENRDRLERLYVDLTPIDTVRTAPLLARVPALMILATGDRIVPARYGERLWELAGCPELWRIDTGHILMFFFLEGRARDMADWLEAHGLPGAG